MLTPEEMWEQFNFLMNHTQTCARHDCSECGRLEEIESILAAPFYEQHYSVGIGDRAEVKKKNVKGAS